MKVSILPDLSMFVFQNIDVLFLDMKTNDQY